MLKSIFAYKRANSYSSYLPKKYTLQPYNYTIHMEKQVTFSSQASYATLGTLSADTQTIWIVCHGYGQLSRNFIRRFDVLDLQTNYVIAPQGLSKFYLGNKYEEVGASWLTKESREQDLHNQLAYIKAVFEQEIPTAQQNNYRYCLLGFSQGVATICRWAVAQQLSFDKLILWAGRVPAEIQTPQLSFIPNHAQIFSVIGNQDALITPEIQEQEQQRLQTLFVNPIKISFEGGHEIKREVIQQIAAY
jgi:predicted esterase